MNKKEHKQNLLDQLYEPYKKCLKCPLGSAGRSRVVFGKGNPDARLMIIGEAPGKKEDEQGIPFVGKSGAFLTKILLDLGIARENVFITNIVKCRPPNNRKPLPIEIKTCTDLLLFNQIKIIQPQAICTLGSTAIEGLLKAKIKISAVHGTLFYFDSIATIPTYHPAYIARNPKMSAVFIEDIKKALTLSQEK